MTNKFRYAAAAVVALGLALPSFIVGFIGLIVLSMYMPLAGILAGFLMDIVFGPPSWMPQIVAYPFTILATGLAIGAIALSKYVR